MRLAKDFIKDLRVKLTEPHTPIAMRTFCDGLRNKIKGEVFFNQGGLPFIREAIVASEFAEKRGALFVRLIPEIEKRPDFELIFPERIERFEQVEADKAKRRRGDEYKGLAKMPARYARHIDISSEEEMIEIVRRAARKKANPYPPGTQLLIYLNLSRFSADECLLPKFSEAVCEARPFFSAVWITWQGVPHQI